MSHREDEHESDDLGEYLVVLRRRKWSVIVPTVLVVAAALMFVYLRTPLYSSTARVQVLPKTAQEVLAVGNGTSFANMDTESTLVTSVRLQMQAADQLTTGGHDAALATDADVSVSVPSNTTFMDITCTTEEPESAQACAQAFADAYVTDRWAVVQGTIAGLRKPFEERIADLNAKIATLRTQIAATTDPASRVLLEADLAAAQQKVALAQQTLDQQPRASSTPAEVVTPADLPTEPSNKDYVTTGLLAAFVGLALGIGFAFLRQRMDKRVGEHEGLDLVLGTPVLAVVPHVKVRRKDPGLGVVCLAEPESPAAEAYRSARPLLLHHARERNVKAILVTGPGEGEGKSTTTANLGVVLARSGYRVAIISCDLRVPVLHRLFRLAVEPGLSEVLEHRIALRDALVRTEVPNLLLLTSGVLPANPSELLGSGAMAAVIAELRANADFVLLDTPPMLVVADALEIAPMADGVLAVVDGSTTTQADVVHLRALLDQVGGRLLGCILNNMDPKAASVYGSYYSASSRYSGAKRKGAPRGEGLERPDGGYPGAFPRGASQVDVGLGSAPFVEVDEILSGNGAKSTPEEPLSEAVAAAPKNPNEDEQPHESTSTPRQAPLPDPPGDASMWR